MAQAESISFDFEGRPARGYLARPTESGSGATVVVIHEWWGLNPHTEDIARRYADAGFIALAPDLYGGTVTKDPTEASKLMHALDADRGVAIISAAIDNLQSTDGVSPDRIGITGFCMGGSFALLAACRDHRIKASAPFYGDAPSDDDLANLQCPVLFIGAELDGWITPAKIKAFAASCAKLGKSCDTKIYEGADHAFFNDTRPQVYDAAAAADAWKRVTSFFAEHLG